MWYSTEFNCWTRIEENKFLFFSFLFFTMLLVKYCVLLTLVEYYLIFHRYIWREIINLIIQLSCNLSTSTMLYNWRFKFWRGVIRIWMLRLHDLIIAILKFNLHLMWLRNIIGMLENSRNEILRKIICFSRGVEAPNQFVHTNHVQNLTW